MLVLFPASAAFANGDDVLPVATTERQAPVNRTLTATAWESYISGFTAPDGVVWGGEHDGQLNVVDIYRYRIAAADGTLVDLQAPDGELLTEAEQNAWYEELGYSQEDPYEFNWNVALCQPDIGLFAPEIPVTFNGMLEWNVSRLGGYPVFTDQQLFDANYNLALTEGNPFVPYVGTSYNRELQTNVVSRPTTGFFPLQYVVTSSAYANIACNTGTGLVSPVRLLDGDGSPLTSRTISLENVFVDINPSEDIELVRINLEGRYVMVTGFALPGNSVATWGITKIGPAQPDPAPSAPGLAKAGFDSDVALAAAIAAVSLGAGGLLWFRRFRIAAREK